jgi:hypothetical protein
LAALIPEEFGGTGLGITEASIILEEINHSGGVATACHAQMYTMGTLLRHGNAEQKTRYLPKIATGELRLQAFGVTEPDAGSESTRIQTTATRKGDRYLINGQKIFISRVLQSDLMLLLARTTPYDELKDKTRGLSVFIVDLKANQGKLEVKPLDLMINHHTNALFFDNVEVPVENLIGEEGMGFRYIIDGWNAERILVAMAVGSSSVPRNMQANAWFSANPSAPTKAFNSPSPRPTPISKPPIWSVTRPRPNLTAGKNAAPKRTWQSTSPPKQRGKPPMPASTPTAATALQRNMMSKENSARPVC